MAGIPEPAAGEKTRARGESAAAGKAAGHGPRTGTPCAWHLDKAVAHRAPCGTRRRARCRVLSGASCGAPWRTRWRIVCGTCHGVPGCTARCDTARSAANVRRPGRARGSARAVTGPRRPRPAASPARVTSAVNRAPRDSLTAERTDAERTALDPERASFLRRIGALAYEALLLVAMAFVAGFLFLPLVSPWGVSHRALTVPPVFARTMMFCALVGGAAAYYGWCWSGGRRTLPQKTWRLRVVDRGGGPLTRRQALIRYAAAWTGPALALLGYGVLHASAYGRNALAFAALNYCWAIIDPDRQFLHDRIAGTRVVNDAIKARR